MSKNIEHTMQFDVQKNKEALTKAILTSLLFQVFTLFLFIESLEFRQASVFDVSIQVK